MAPALRLTGTATLVPLLTDASGSIAPLAVAESTTHAGPSPGHWAPGENPKDGASGSAAGLNQLAWCEEVGPYDCYLADQLADQAEQRAIDLSKQNDWDASVQNAFRHAYWLGLLTANGFSVEEALALGDAHERDGDTAGQLYGSEDSNADQHNSQVGAYIMLERFDVSFADQCLLLGGAPDHCVEHLGAKVSPSLAVR
ncbi:DUF6973 domain-containing protein [Micromonospora sp. GCM10011542]|uniref:DUF6973 domain-containing protein n=1 Tax=Micromonospora sp. GCM10011542 TaxID=3317337 RepID=UPI00361E1FB2